MRRAYLSLLTVLLGVVSGDSGQYDEVPATPGPDQCMYTFTVPATALRSQCMTLELQHELKKINDDYEAIKKENHDLKEKLDTVEQDYREMVNTVKLLKKETASWRAVVNWPQLDEQFKPDDLSLVMKEDRVYDDCNTAMKRGNNKPGIYKIQPEGSPRTFFSFCDEEGWTVIYRRFDGNMSFNRNWNDFSGGFGELTGEFFIGLENLHELTAERPSEFYMEALGWNDKLYTAYHADFEVHDEMDDYMLTVGQMVDGNYHDVLSELNGTKFTTSDVDNDEWFNNNCATYYKGGWWLKNCGFDPSRQWCEGGGCASWGEVNVKKIMMKVRHGDPPPNAGRGKGKGKGRGKGRGRR